jgi:hypothetical protein
LAARSGCQDLERSRFNPNPTSLKNESWYAAKAKEISDAYKESILKAWDAYRPNGPLAGEVLPNEVERLRGSWNQ